MTSKQVTSNQREFGDRKVRGGTSSSRDGNRGNCCRRLLQRIRTIISFHQDHGGSGKGHLNSKADTNIVNASLYTPGNYSGNLIEQKNSRVRLVEDMKSSECQATETDAYVGDD